MHRLAAMASFLAAMLLLLSLPAAVHGKNMKFSRTLSFNDNLGDALKDLVGDLKNSEKANKQGGQCTFKCENGEKATKRANYFPVTDGCMVRTRRGAVAEKSRSPSSSASTGEKRNTTRMLFQRCPFNTPVAKTKDNNQ